MQLLASSSRVLVRMSVRGNCCASRDVSGAAVRFDDLRDIENAVVSQVSFYSHLETPESGGLRLLASTVIIIENLPRQVWVLRRGRFSEACLR